MITLIAIAAGILILYYPYTMIPYWFKQGYRAKDKRKPLTFKKEVIQKLPQPSQNNYEANKKKGDEFERYIVNLFNADSNRFRLNEWRSDKMADNGMYALSNHLPDLEMVFIDGKREYKFAIECKWRTNFTNGAIEWAKEYQIKNYLQYQKRNRIPVFVAIGIGGTPSKPENLYLAPLNDVHFYPSLYESYLKQFYRNPSHRFFYNPRQKILY